LNVVWQAALLLTIGWLPGAVILRAPFLDRNRRAALDAEERTFWAVLISLAISLGGVLGLAALHQYSLTRLVMLDVALAAAVAVASGGRLRMRGAARLTLTAGVPIALLLLGGLRFFPPAEYIIGGKDPGVYLNEGIQIAQRGTFLYRDPVIADLPPFARPLFVRQHRHTDGSAREDYYGVRFMGFFVKDAETGTVVGQFPHLFPASVALGYGVDGLTGARRVAGVWALLGLMAVYFAGARLFGKPAAAAACVLLALHVLEIWFARYPNAEAVMQTFVFAALLANARAHVDGDRFFAPVSAALLGLLLFLRFDAILAIGGIVIALGAGLFAGQRPRLSFGITLAALAGIAALYLVGPMRAYVELPRAYFLRLIVYTPWWQYVLGVAGVAGAAVLAWRAHHRPGLRTTIARTVPWGVALAVLAGAVYAMAFREPGGRLTDYDAYALRTFANLYLTVPGLAAAVLGFVLLSRDRFWRDPALFITIAVFAFSVFYKLRIVPEHFWLGRRFVPVVLPGAMLFIAAAVFATSAAGWRAKAVRWTLGGILLVLLASTFARISRPVADHTEYAGLIPQLEHLANRFGPNDLVIVESRDAGGDIHVLATPLAYIYARNVLLLDGARPDKATLATFIEWARTKYDQVFFVGGGGTDLLSHSYGLRPMDTQRFQVPEYESTTDGLPRVINRKDLEFGVFAFTDPAPRREDGWFELDLGGNDDLHVLRFHAREASDGRTFRWTLPTSYISVTTINPSAREAILVLHDGGRPDAAAPAQVDVFLHNQRLGTIDVQPGGFRPYTLSIPPDLADRAAASRDPVELRLVSTTWKPREVLGTDDDRELGVMVDRVTIK
jgi:hypothetical protein